MNKNKQGGNIREGDIVERNPLRKKRISEIHEQEAQEDILEYMKREWEKKNNDADPFEL